MEVMALLSGLETELLELSDRADIDRQPVVGHAHRLVLGCRHRLKKEQATPKVWVNEEDYTRLKVALILLEMAMTVLGLYERERDEKLQYQALCLGHAVGGAVLGSRNRAVARRSVVVEAAVLAGAASKYMTEGTGPSVQVNPILQTVGITLVDQATPTLGK